MKKNRILRWIFNKLYRLKPPEFVQYWRTGDKARAKLTVLKDGSYAMYIEGEKYPLYGFPRGPVLFGPLARLKHLVKNLIFNEPWRLLEEGKTDKEVLKRLGDYLPAILDEVEKNKYDFFPPERMCPAMRELWRALSVIEERVIKGKKDFDLIKRGITFFLQEDDAYRFRFQWIAQFGNPNSFLRKTYRFFTRKPYSLRDELDSLFAFLEQAEVVPDMKGRIALIRRIVNLLLGDEVIGKVCQDLALEIDWNKIKLSKADKYYFRGKYFKVDADVFDY